MTQFEQLSDIIDLWKAGRKNAAKAQWKALTKEFQDKMLDYMLFILERPQEISSTPLVTLRSTKFGIFNCYPSTLLDLVEILPSLV